MHCRTCFLRTHQVAERDELALRIRHFDTDRRLTGDRRKDSHVRCGHRVRNVARERGHLGDLDATAERQLVTSDGGASRVAHELGLHSVLTQRLDETLSTFHGDSLVRAFMASNGEHVERGQCPRARLGSRAERHLLWLTLHQLRRARCRCCSRLIGNVHLLIDRFLDWLLATQPSLLRFRLSLCRIQIVESNVVELGTLT